MYDEKKLFIILRALWVETIELKYEALGWYDEMKTTYNHHTALRTTPPHNFRESNVGKNQPNMLHYYNITTLYNNVD